MMIPKENKLAIYRYLLQEGVLTAPKNFKLEKHPLIESVSNLEVLMIMKSLKSMKHVTETFNWQNYYWILTNKGVQFLSAYLQVPEGVVPATHKKPTSKPTVSRPYHPRGDDAKRAGGPSDDFNPSYNRSGPRRPMGRGAYREGQSSTTTTTTATPQQN
ncbi:40S ribosomal protein S10 [Tieghemostelium lacteum]|uniref:40S ribosomal protein S10 n=1 Tax=Tieghemostelium lacteum TaxID=361077 RepID=A0A151ZD58_TIELA|nr:40S ribosomal protein S10 [Tieghemostelium lacteum]|eukprot:KYQ91814.1 40S ribosomal protein S10 [Tieghemostelium lacteum]